MGYLTERELIERYQYYTIQLEERLVEGEDFETVCNPIPFVLHLSNAETFEIISANKRFFELTGYALEEIQADWMGYVQNTIHPDSVRSISSFLPHHYEKGHKSKPISFVQYARVNNETKYSPLVVCTKPAALPGGQVLWASPLAKNLNTDHRKIERVIEMDTFKLRHFRQFQSLTNREVEILGLLASGYNNPAIAEKLYLSRETVETHRKNLKRKLDLKSLRDLMRYALSFNLIEF